MSVLYTLVLLRHGQSQWNLENRFTGWTEVDLTGKGRQEARQAGELLRAAGLRFDLAYTSMQQRSMESLALALEALQQPAIPVETAWQLNERHYGALQGLNKAETARRLGASRVMAWRRSYTARPPALEFDDYRHPRFDPRYAGLPPESLPRAESLQDTVARLLPYWRSAIVPAIQNGQRVLVVAHGNSLRALVKYLEDLPEAQIPGLEVPTGLPWVYKLDIDLHPKARYTLK